MIMYDIAIIGAGIFGSWTAWHLVRAGRRVLLLDAWGAGHSRSSSGGESRIIRMGYGQDALYTGMAAQSLALWKQLEKSTGESIFHPTGVLWMARGTDPYSAATQSVLAEAGVPFEVLTAAGLAERFPQFGLPAGDAYGIFEPESGTLMARRAVSAVVRNAVSFGLEYGIAAVRVSPQGRVQTANGEEIRAGAYVFACGPWLPKVFPEVLGPRIFPTRQEVMFFAPRAGDSQFSASAFPAWIDFSDPRGPYGFPDLEGRGVKLAFDLHGPAFDPDTGERQVSAGSVDAARQFLADRIPALRDAPLTETRVCQYESTSNGDFLLDRHPEFANVWLAGGGSGHGFKHGPAVGAYLCARLVEGGGGESRFSLASKLETQQRTVY
jgi:sarcosine oxidase